jgi:tetratricopeptide (TPR) repeat protein
MAVLFQFRIAVLLGLLPVLAGAVDGQETLDTYYAYPVSLGIGYQAFSAISGVERKASVNAVSLDVCVPLPFLPVIQPSLVGGLTTLDSDESAAPTILGGMLDAGATLPDYDERETWDHQCWFGGLGLDYSRRISREFEAGADILAAMSLSYFPRRVVTASGQWYAVGEPGMMLGLGGKISLNPSFNLSFDITPAFRYSRTFGNLPDFDGLYFGIGFAAHYRFGQDPDAPQAEIRALRITVDEFPPVFAAMQKVYVKQPITWITVTNVEGNPVTDLAVTFNQATYMDSPTLCIEIETLGPDESIKVPVHASLNDAVFGTVDVVPLNGEIIVGYTYKGRPATQSRSVVFDLMDRNSVVWDDDRKVAAFITPRDSAVRNYASFVADRSEGENADSLPKPLQVAMQTYAALAAIGLGYQSDPTSPFALARSSLGSVDSVSLPRETLKRGTGDCDDITVLFNTMLESVNTQTAFVTIPGHIYSAVNTGLSPRDFARVHPDRRMTLVNGDSLWVLIEITLIGKSGFIEAWETGMRQWNELDGNESDRNFYTTKAAQADYQPVGLQETDLGLQYGDPEAFISVFRRDRDRLAALLLSSLRKQAETVNNAISWNKLGISAAQLRQFKLADESFSQSIRLDAGYVNARVNLGALRFLQADYTGALDAFENAVSALGRSAQPSQTALFSTYVNLARTLHALGRGDDAAGYLARAAAIDPVESARYQYMTVTGQTNGRAASAADMPSIRFVEDREE